MGLDLIGLAAVSRLEELLDEPNRPSDLAALRPRDVKRVGGRPPTLSAVAPDRLAFLQ